MRNQFFLALSFFVAAPAAAQIAIDQEVPVTLTGIKREIQVSLSDCLDLFNGYQCRVNANVEPLMAVKIGTETQRFDYNVGGMETVTVVFEPADTGYSVTVYPGSVSGPYTSYVRRAFRQMPAAFTVHGLKVVFDEL